MTTLNINVQITIHNEKLITRFIEILQMIRSLVTQ